LRICRPRDYALTRRLVNPTRQRGAPLAGASAQLFVERVQEFPPRQLVKWRSDFVDGRPAFPPRPPGRAQAGLRRDPASGREQLAADGALEATKLGISCQDQEHRLTRILGVLHRRQRPAANAQDHPGMSSDDNLERGLVALGEPAKQVAVGKGGRIRIRSERTSERRGSQRHERASEEVFTLRKNLPHQE
jgi:hypothetical protein